MHILIKTLGKITFYANHISNLKTWILRYDLYIIFSRIMNNKIINKIYRVRVNQTDDNNVYLGFIKNYIN